MPPYVPTQDAPDTRLVVPNLLAYIAAQVGEAVKWANGGVALPEFKKLFTSAEGRVHQIFPDLMVLSESAVARQTDAGLQIEYELLFELEIVGKSADVVTALAKTYVYAVESMLVNIPPATLLAGTSLDLMVILRSIGHDIGQQGRLDSQHFRAPRVRANWTFSELNYG
jgi:hypothetical protein